MRRIAGSITRCFARIRAGDSDAAGWLWARYFPRLYRFARRRLSSSSRRVTDEEDLIVSVFAALVRGAQLGSFPELADRDELMRLMTAIMKCKASTRGRREGSKKRGGGKVRGGSAFDCDRGGPTSFEEVAGESPTPHDISAAVDEYRHLLGLLPSESLRGVVEGILLGRTSQELALKQGVSRRTVQRKLELIRAIWSNELRRLGGGFA